MSLPPLLGPVDIGASFMLASLQNGQPFVLNASPVPGGFLYYWESSLEVIAQTQRLGIFSAQGSLNSLTLHDAVNGGGIAFRSDGITIGNAPEPATVKMSQSGLANWNPPDIFLSAVPYTLYNSSGVTAHVLTAITGGTGPVIPSIPADNLVILPVLWYFNCNSSGKYDVINQPFNSVVNWFCVANSSTSGCSGIDITPSGWTTLGECTVGNRYTYCPTGNVCGNNNCKGPCSSEADDCNFSNGQYVCAFDINRFVNDTEWWESPYFIGGIFATIFIIIIIFIVIYVIGRGSQ